ncbi:MULTISPECIES: hypothetical protein [Bacillus]|nr:hypothetical protein [Bacillus sp. UNC437CL72CviS29]
MKNISKVEFATQQLKLAYENLKNQQEIVKQCEKSLEEAVKNEM